MEMDRPMEDHEYVWTIVGRCLRCQRTVEAHPKYHSAEHGECPVDHSSITSRHDGQQWNHCPQCGEAVEPRLATGEATGPRWGLGRGGIGPRLQKRLEFINWRNRDAF